MNVIRGYNAFPVENRGSVITLGNFDGVHKGHQHLIQNTIEIAKRNSSQSSIMTFEPHPRSFFQPQLPPYRITPTADKIAKLEELGLDNLVINDFNKPFSEITAEDFVDEILVKKLGISAIVIGHDFIFGKNRSGNAELLKSKAEEHQFKFIQMDPLSENGTVYSSTKIRQFLRDGDIPSANNFLGREYEISGIIEKGEQRGRTIGCPTANIYLGDHIRAKFGVYQVTIQIKADGEWLPAVANLGCKPSFNDNRDVLEVFIFDFDEEIYDKNVRVKFYKFIRAEEKFSDLESLEKQIQVDCEIVKNLF